MPSSLGRLLSGPPQSPPRPAASCSDWPRTCALVTGWGNPEPQRPQCARSGLVLTGQPRRLAADAGKLVLQGLADQAGTAWDGLEPSAST